MSEVRGNNKRIAKNTGFLYIRTILMMLVMFYTSRVVFQNLGVEDFGLYNIIGGVVVLFSFLETALQTATQRYLNYELGCNDKESASRVFSASLSIYFGLCVIVFVVAETVGLWFIETQIQIPEGRENAAFWTYQLVVLMTCSKIIRIPYNASIIAFEKMNFYAYISIVEVLLQLLIAFLLSVGSYDRLILYSFLMFLASLLISFAYFCYCKKKFDICVYHRFWDKPLYFKLMSFSGWSLFGGIAALGSSQGANVLINVFFGVAVNAAAGISQQVSSAIYTFVGNFQTAFKPQLVKSYASGNMDYFLELIINASKYSFYLFIVLAIPVLINIDTFLKLWLGTVPEYSVEFCSLIICICLIEAIVAPLHESVLAIGNIRNYYILIGSMLIMNLPISYILLKQGYFVNSIFVVKLVISFVMLLIRIMYLKMMINFSIRRFIIKIILPCVIIVGCIYPIALFIAKLDDGLIWGLVSSLIGGALTVLYIYLFGISRSERNELARLFKRYL